MKKYLKKTLAVIPESVTEEAGANLQDFIKDILVDLKPKMLLKTKKRFLNPFMFSFVFRNLLYELLSTKFWGILHSLFFETENLLDTLVCGKGNSLFFACD